MPTQLTDDDELLHDPSAEPAWTETYGFEFAAAGGHLAGFVVMTAHPLLGRSWCWAAVAGRDRAVCMVDEPDAPLPRRTSMELRAPALWVDVAIEIPFVHATVGMEAFGLVFEDPDEALRSGFGERTPFGLDLEWESDAANPSILEATAAGAAADLDAEADGYALVCRVSGEVLLGQERHEIDASGRRWHRWGSRAWWDEPAAENAGAIAHVVTPLPFPSLHAVAVRAALDDHGWSVTRHRAAGAAGMAP